MSETFINDDFLLKGDFALKLYHDHAAHLPIIDYHNHLSPSDIAENKIFATITEAWLAGDHYKWRAMRANGVSEAFITGSADDKTKFLKWAETVPYTMRNPLYHWTHLELKRYFGISDLLNEKNALDIYNLCTEKLQDKAYSTQGLLSSMNVELVCTTDDPTDDLAHHKKMKEADSDIQMLPTFRPDKFCDIQHSGFLSSIESLASIVHFDINSFDTLIEALAHRIEYFSNHGCQLADHGLSQLFKIDKTLIDNNRTLEKKKLGQDISREEAAVFQMSVLHELGQMYHSRGWVMQLHLGAIRNNNTRLLKSVGADVGCDSIGDYPQAEGLSYFLNGLDQIDKLPKTILYNLNPRDNELFATMAGNFNDGSSAGKIQWGSAWWFLDQKDGMEKQINALSNMGLLSRFIGMLTDSRSFLSFPRHEYFRRILCQVIGADVDDGLLPHDMGFLSQMVRDICYRNAKRYLEV